jgi:hypothetical protein
VPTMSLLSTYIVTIVPTQVHAISSTACGPTCTITINKHAQLHISETIILVEILPGPIPSWNLSSLVGQDGVLCGANGSTRPVPERENLVPHLVL